MRPRALVLALVGIAALQSSPGVASQGVAVDLERINVLGNPVAIELVNWSDEPITMGDSWTIASARRGEVLAEYCWTRAERTIEPGKRRVWRWDQRNDAYGNCIQSHPGEQVAPGPYVVTFHGLDLTRRFHIGQFFTVGFDHLSEDETFTVFVNRASDIAQMTGEAEAEEKTAMVTGIVRGERPYNPRWNFTMGPGSIILAEVSIEVCDADPYYVQDHRRHWLGDRWCPWGSYVAAVGR